MTGEAPAGSFLAALCPQEREALCALGRARTLRRDETLFHEGDPSDFVVLILRGDVKVSSVAETGVETVLAVRTAGGIVGEMSALDGAPRSAKVTALGQVEVRIIPARDFSAFLDAHPRVLRALLTLVTGRLREADQQRVAARTLDVRGRIARLLLELSRTHGRDTAEGTAIDLRFSQQEFAEWAGASREAVVKALRFLRERGAISTQRHSVTILRSELLERLAHPPAGRSSRGL